MSDRNPRSDRARPTRPPEESAEQIEARYRLAARLATVAALFVLLVGALMTVSHFQVRGEFPFQHPKIAALKAQLDKRPQDEALKTRIRVLDRQVRERYFRQRAVSHQGAWLILGGLVVFVLSLKAAKQLRKRLPKPSADALTNPWLIAGVARQAVLTLGVVFACGFAVLILLSRHDLSREYGKDVWSAASRKVSNGYPSIEEMAKNWPQFRGPRGLGVVTVGTAPSRWDGASGQGIAWKTPVPLPGKSSPVVWGDRVFLSGGTEEKRQVFCFDAKDGKLLWSKDVGTPGKPPEPSDGSGGSIPEDTGYAASTMATDGQRAFAVFATGDVACFDYAGNSLWARNLGRPQSMYGYAASLALYRNRLILQYDQGSAAEDGKSALLALDASTGQTVWQTKRPVPNSWASPIVIDTGKGEEIITCANPFVIAYDPESGQERWRAECLSGDVAPSPVYSGGMVFACNTGSNLAAIRTGGKGDVTKTNVAWMAQEGLPDITSPAANCELVFTVMSEGTITCFDAVKGTKVWDHPLNKPVRSSPTLVGRSVYLVDQEGVTHLFDAARSFKETGQAALGEAVETTPAFVNGRIYIRGKDHLYCIGSK